FPATTLFRSPLFLVNSRLGLFTAADLRQRPFSLSYGAILPSSLTRVRSLTLEFSSRLPVSVCGTGSLFLPRNFSWQCDIGFFGTHLPSPSHLVYTTRSI